MEPDLTKSKMAIPVVHHPRCLNRLTGASGRGHPFGISLRFRGRIIHSVTDTQTLILNFQNNFNSINLFTRIGIELESGGGRGEKLLFFVSHRRAFRYEIA